MYKKWNDYLIYEDGKVFCLIKNKFLKMNVTCYGYGEYWLKINNTYKRYKTHRLVAYSFLGNPPKNKEIVNHKDGNKLNNHYSNLEWCDYYYNNKHARDMGLNNISLTNSLRWQDKNFREKTSKNISIGRIKNECAKGKKNPMFRYLIYKNDIEISKNELINIINKSESYINSLIRKSSLGQSIPLFIENNIKIIDTKKKS